MRIPTALIAGLIGSTLAVPALAEPISYQGQFNDGGKVPVGSYDIRFTVYDAASGGTVVGSVLTRSVVLGSGDSGVFSFQDLDFGAGVFNGSPRWIEVAIRTGADAFTVLSPRQPVAAVPEALFAQRSGTSLNDAFANGGLINNAGAGFVQLTGGMLLGSGGSDGQLRLFQAGAPAPIMQLFPNAGLGAVLLMRDNEGNTTAVLEADPNGIGSSLTLNGDGGQFVFDGDIGPGTNSGSRLSVTGPVSSFVFDTTVAGDASVVLPGSSIGPAEMFAEAGVANSTRVGGASLTATFATVTSRTITVPAPGYVVAFASCRLAITRPTLPAIFGTLIYGLSESPTTIPDSQRNVLQMPGSALTPGSYVFPGSTHGLFNVDAAGDHTFYFNARQTNFATGTVLDTNLTLIYFPTAYGSVDGPLLSAQGGYSLDAGVGPGLSREEILAEQLAEQERAMAEMRAEQARMKRQMEEIKARLPRETTDR